MPPSPVVIDLTGCKENVEISACLRSNFIILVFNFIVCS